MSIDPQKDDWLFELLTDPSMQPKPSPSNEPELFMAGIPEKLILYYTLFPAGRQWGAQILEPDNALVFELSDFGNPWREDSKAEMIQTIKEAFPRYDACHVSHELFKKTRVDRESQANQ